MWHRFKEVFGTSNKYAVMSEVAFDKTCVTDSEILADC